MFDPNDPNQTDPTPESDPTPSPPAPAAPTNSSNGGGTNHQLKNSGEVRLATADFKKIKDRAREQGKKEALNALARERGFSSAEDLLKALDEKAAHEKAAKPSGNGQPERANQPPARDQSKAGAHHRAEAERWRARAQEEKQARREAERNLEAKQVEMAIRMAATKAGIVDTDMALYLLDKHLENLGTDEAAKLDEVAFFSGLRDERPYLFEAAKSMAPPAQPTARPATTGIPGTGANRAPPPPQPGKVAKGLIEGEKFDGRKASPQQLAERLSQLGISPTDPH